MADLSKRWPTQVNAAAFYGDPCGRNAQASPKWERQNLVLIPCPWPLVTAWNGGTVKSIRIHRHCAESLSAVLDAIWKAAAGDLEIVRAWGMHLYGGGYYFRPARGESWLSMHAYGCAVDFDPARNGWKNPRPNFASVPAVLEAFAAEGWIWGGSWAKKDGMHWQAARTK